MRSLAAVTALLAPFAAAAPRGTATAIEPPTRALEARQGVVTPPPCEAMDPPPTEEETEARFDMFVEAFINEADISEAFKYIANDYIVSVPFLFMARHTIPRRASPSREC